MTCSDIARILPLPFRRDVLLKSHDIFTREFGWPVEFLRFPKEKLDFQLNFTQSFEYNLSVLAQKFGLSDKEINDLRKYEIYFIVTQLEITNYDDKRLLDRIYSSTFSQLSNTDFKNAATHLIHQVEIFEDFSPIEEHFQNRILRNVLLGIAFEYACKGLLLSKCYSINAYNPPKGTSNGLIEPLPINTSIRLIASKTLGLGSCWRFIKQKKLIPFERKEEMIGNYLTFLRNVQAHTIILMACRGSYNDESIQLIRKIILNTETT